jgi:hypothetical protein
MSVRKLNPEQIKVVKTYFEALAFFRDEQYQDPGNDILSCSTGAYASIMTDGGGDPVKLAARLVFGADAVDLKIMP